MQILSPVPGLYGAEHQDLHENVYMTTCFTTTPNATMTYLPGKQLS